MKTNWRDNVEDSVKKHLELQIRESFKHRDAIQNSPNPNISQLWVAIANLSKQNFELELKIKMLEKTVFDLMNKQISENINKSKKKRK